jgi:exodeoxyribonuclease-1
MAATAAAPRSFYWHDYETFGLDTQRDRPVQFAGLRTDTNLEPRGDPLVLYARPAADYLPSPEACLVTGITPQLAHARGLPEVRFIERILAELAAPGTCGVGYNSLRFDDEVTRQTLYRNLCDPYAREWRNGNSRWDLLNMARAAYALRPDGMTWPRRDDGSPSFRLEELTAANGIEHGQAHDALADVQATLALARRLRDTQPRLWDFLLGLRDKRAAAELVDLRAMTPLVHVSGRYPAARGCLALVAPVARHLEQANVVIVYDLSSDPGALAELDVAALAERVFTAAGALPEGVERIPLKQVRLNRCPVLAPAGVLRPADAERLGIDLEHCRQHLAQLRTMQGLASRVAAAFASPGRPLATDPDEQLYGGPFLGDADRQRLDEIRATDPSALCGLRPAFDDPRLAEMLFRFRARNYPETLAAEERETWRQFRRRRLLAGEAAGSGRLESYFEQIASLRATPHATGREGVLDALEAYARELARELGEAA